MGINPLLSQQIKSGDHAAFETLFKAEYSHLCAYANSIIGDLDASEDLVQDFMFHLWQKKEELPIDIEIRAYLFKSVHNRCLNVLKHRKVTDQHRIYTLHTHSGLLYEDKDSTVNELHDKIREAIDKLPPERRKAFVMHRYDELKYKEIAEKLNLSIKTVENQIGKALSFLRNELKDYMPIAFFLFLNFLKKN